MSAGRVRALRWRRAAARPRGCGRRFVRSSRAGAPLVAVEVRAGVGRRGARAPRRRRPSRWWPRRGPGAAAGDAAALADPAEHRRPGRVPAGPARARSSGRGSSGGARSPSCCPTPWPASPSCRRPRSRRASASEIDELLRFRLEVRPLRDPRGARSRYAAAGRAPRTRRGGGRPGPVLDGLRGGLPRRWAWSRGWSSWPGWPWPAPPSRPAGAGDRLLVNWDEGYVTLILARDGWPILVRTLSGADGGLAGEVAREVDQHGPLLPRAAGRRRASRAGSCARAAVPAGGRRVDALGEPHGVRARGARPLARAWGGRCPAAAVAGAGRGRGLPGGAAMRPLNLARRPFRNERLPATLFALAAVVLAGLTVWHAVLVRGPAARAHPSPPPRSRRAWRRRRPGSARRQARAADGAAPEPKALAQWTAGQGPGGPPRLLLDRPLRARSRSCSRTASGWSPSRPSVQQGRDRARRDGGGALARGGLAVRARSSRSGGDFDGRLSRRARRRAASSATRCATGRASRRRPRRRPASARTPPAAAASRAVGAAPVRARREARWRPPGSRCSSLLGLEPRRSTSPTRCRGAAGAERWPRRACAARGARAGARQRTDALRGRAETMSPNTRRRRPFYADAWARKASLLPRSSGRSRALARELGLKRRQPHLHDGGGQGGRGRAPFQMTMP